MIVIGAMFLLSGLITMIISYIKQSRAKGGFWSLQGIINVLFGLLFIGSPSLMAEFFISVVGIILLIMGTFQLIGSLGTLSKLGWSLIFFLIALATIASGIILLTETLKSAEFILKFIGVILAINGISELLRTWKVAHQPQTYKGTTVQDIPYEEV